DLLAELNPFIVESGSEGHRHAYIPLSEPVGLDRWQQLQTALRARLKGDAKIADNDLLRFPGTWNHKTDPPNPVRCLPWTGKPWNPDDLATLLDVGQDGPPPPEQITPEQPPDPLPPVVREVLDDDSDVDDRSKAHHRLVTACHIAGLTTRQTFAVASHYVPSRAKYGDRLAEEIARSWGKIEAESATEQAPTTTSPTTCGPELDHNSGGGGGGKAIPRSIVESRETFRRWLGKGYDIEAHDVLLCALAAEKLGGDPLWLLIISGSGNAKTETVQSAAGIEGTIVTSTISSEGALLSATPTKDKVKGATGGLLRKLGERGVLVIKDVTSILAMNRDTRGAVLAAFREIHDGHWARNVGTDGGRTLTWKGRIVVIGAVTTAWDRAHDVIAAMGDRFVLLRMDSTNGRPEAGRQAIANTGREEKMRTDLSKAVAGVMAGLDTSVDVDLTEDEVDRLLAAADLVTLARTGVDYDYRGDVIDAHAPEMPTRFTKQLTQLVRGGLTLGLSREHAMH
ncbi:MAG: hypothetical protein LC808_16310, partial [Actinobacteria bacterium]|nr:hypothetical protein [Actinomycetota bacterium]